MAVEGRRLNRREALRNQVLALPGLVLLEHHADVPDDSWLPTGGFLAFGGALRMLPSRPRLPLPSVDTWNRPSTWKRHFRQLAPQWDAVGEDAFGTQYLLRPDGREMALFWPEDGTVERVGKTPAEFLAAIARDPDSTLLLPLFRSCVKRFGPLPPRAHFAFRVELAVGGKPEVRNVDVWDARQHLRVLAMIALQIHDLPQGTKLVPVLK